MTYTIQELRDKNLIIFEARMGSHAYGTALPTSDIDTRGVFIQPLDDVLQHGYVEQVSDDKNDTTFYELKRFMSLARKNNPNIVEILFAPEDSVLIETVEWKMIKKFNKNFLTTLCLTTFGGYAIAQIEKSKGYNKKMNWEENDTKRKNVLDFCYVLVNNDSLPLNKWLGSENHTMYGLSAMDHTRGVYAMFKAPEGETWGVVSNEETANDVMLTSIPKGLKPVAYLSFNKDGYSSHCKKYQEYTTWLENRNPDRVKMNKDHGKNYDSKNMMHTLRLIGVAEDIAKQGIVIVKRPPEEIEKLMRVRRGEYEYDDLLKEARERIKGLDDLFAKSNLPDSVSYDFVSSLELAVRKLKYGRS